MELTVKNFFSWKGVIGACALLAAIHNSMLGFNIFTTIQKMNRHNLFLAMLLVLLTFSASLA
ncbi:MAG: hypothetical protein ACK5R5_08030, partial [Alphaproteobacteria bacterium]